MINQIKMKFQQKIRELEKVTSVQSQEEVKEEISHLRNENGSLREQLNDLKNAVSLNLSSD